MQFGIKRISYLFFFFVLAWLILRFLLPLLSPFLIGLGLALAAEPVVQLLSGKVHLPRSISAGIGVSSVFLLLCGCLLTLCSVAIRELGKLSDFLPGIAQTVHQGISLVHTWLLQLSSKASPGIQPFLQEGIRTLFSGSTALLEQTVRYILGFAGNLLSHIPDSALTIATAILSAFMISAKLPMLKALVLKRFPQERLASAKGAWRRIRSAVAGWFLAELKLMGVTFGILFLGFALLRISNPLLWAGAVALVDAFPILGTGTILLPWSLIRLLQGDTALAIGLLGLYATVSLIRSALEPKLVGKHLGLDPLVTLIALYAGFQLWGIGGMLLSPLLTVAAIQAFPTRRS